MNNDKGNMYVIFNSFSDDIKKVLYKKTVKGLNLLNYLLSFGVIWNNSVRLFGALSFGHLAELIFIR